MSTEAISPVSEICVRGRDQLIAALKAAACRTQSEARQNPCGVRLEGLPTTYNFPEGLTETRANQIVRKIRSTRAGAFR